MYLHMYMCVHKFKMKLFLDSKCIPTCIERSVFERGLILSPNMNICIGFSFV